jgi:hypothetical protein
MYFEARAVMTASKRVAVLAGLMCVSAMGQKFYPDDPLSAEPKPHDASNAISRKVSDYYDFFVQTFATQGEKHPPGSYIPAQGVDTLGEPLEGAWYAKRHYYRPMTIEELVRGPGNDAAPAAEGQWTVVKAKSEGVTPGFEIVDSNKRRFVMKFDPRRNPEIATAPDILVSKFFHALGYHVPQNYIVEFTADKLSLAENVTLIDPAGKTKPMTRRDLIELLLSTPNPRSLHFRASASLYLDGKPMGPFRYHGMRKDDPNDIYPHEHRRELRGLAVFCAWFNHDDSRAINTQDMLVNGDGKSYLRHHLIDFGSTLGSASYGPNSPRSGFEYVFEWDPVVKNFASLGFHVPWWAKAKYPKLKAVGVFESAVFDPERWIPEYPNPAFLNMLPDDAFWAAKQVMAFTDEQIHAIVRTGGYSDSRVVDYITKCLIERRDKIGKAYFRPVLPVDRFRIEKGALKFDDLGVLHGMVPDRQYQVQWSVFDNPSSQKKTIPGATTLAIPAANAEYLAADIHGGDPTRAVTVYLRRRGGEDQVVGIDRTWRK